jgi:putative IMPACT (imprinted ancient) family translation regulator
MVSEASEDREPISSMKKAKTFLERDDIRNQGVYIVRYYGGTQLGASHLDHVYFSLAMKLLGKKD